MCIIESRADDQGVADYMPLHPGLTSHVGRSGCDKTFMFDRGPMRTWHPSRTSWTIVKRRRTWRFVVMATLFSLRAWALGAQGDTCDTDAGAPCGSGLTCQDGYCCDTACDRGCEMCNYLAIYGTGQNGHCVNRPAGAEGRPMAENLVDCNHVLCDGFSPTCRRSCDATDAYCAKGFWCPSNQCVPQLATGSDCDSSRKCASGYCVARDGKDGPVGAGVPAICCENACNKNGACDACTRDLTGLDHDGLCGNVKPDKPDRCLVDRAAPCGNTGFCDGAGQCALAPEGIQVGETTCSSDGGMAFFNKTTCDGKGVCMCVTLPCPWGCDKNGCVPVPEAGVEDGSGADSDAPAADVSFADAPEAEPGPDEGSETSPPRPSCYPYAGDGDGGCLDRCETQRDCVAPAKCHFNNHCSAGLPGERCWWPDGGSAVFTPDGGCGEGTVLDPDEVVGRCSMSRRRGASYEGWMWVSLLSAWWARRRRTIPV